MRYCIHCGKEIKEEAGFCPYCGKKQAKPAEKKEDGGIERQSARTDAGKETAKEIISQAGEKGAEFGRTGVNVMQDGTETANDFGNKMGSPKKYLKVAVPVIVVCIVLIAVVAAVKNREESHMAMVKYFDKLVNMTYKDILYENKGDIITNDNLMQFDFSEELTKALTGKDFTESGREGTPYLINFEVPGFEGDQILSAYPSPERFWLWENILPEGKTINDCKEYDILVSEFTKKYGEPYKYHDVDEYGDVNEYTVIRQGYKMGSYFVGFSRSNKSFGRVMITVKFAWNEDDDKEYVGDGNSDHDSSDNQDEDSE